MAETKQLINPNLGVLCLDAQELIIQGWRFKDGYPQLIGWQYHAELVLVDKPIPVIPQPTTGRPPKAK